MPYTEGGKGGPELCRRKDREINSLPSSFYYYPWEWIIRKTNDNKDFLTSLLPYKERISILLLSLNERTVNLTTLTQCIK